MDSYMHVNEDTLEVRVDFVSKDTREDYMVLHLTERSEDGFKQSEVVMFATEEQVKYMRDQLTKGLRKAKAEARATVVVEGSTGVESEVRA